MLYKFIKLDKILSYFVENPDKMQSFKTTSMHCILSQISEGAKKFLQESDCIMSILQGSFDNGYPFIGKSLFVISQDEIIGTSHILKIKFENVFKNDKYVSNDNEYLIMGVCVNPNFRGKNICKKMITKIINKYKDSVIFLVVKDNNISAIKCYEYAGFVKNDNFIPAKFNKIGHNIMVYNGTTNLI